MLIVGGEEEWGLDHHNCKGGFAGPRNRTQEPNQARGPFMAFHGNRPDLNKSPLGPKFHCFMEFGQGALISIDNEENIKGCL